MANHLSSLALKTPQGIARSWLPSTVPLLTTDSRKEVCLRSFSSSLRAPILMEMSEGPLQLVITEYMKLQNLGHNDVTSEHGQSAFLLSLNNRIRNHNVMSQASD